MNTLSEEHMISRRAKLDPNNITKVLKKDNPEKHVISGFIDVNTEEVVLCMGNSSLLEVPFSYFKESVEGISPNFGQFSINDYGTCIIFGDYHVLVETLLPK